VWDSVLRQVQCFLSNDCEVFTPTDDRLFLPRDIPVFFWIVPNLFYDKGQIFWSFSLLLGFASRICHHR